MQISEMIDLVREQADADPIDAPGTLLRMYARAAYDDIRRRIHPWPKNRKRYTFTTNQGVNRYSFDQIVGVTGGADLEYPISMIGPRERVTFIDFQTYLRIQESEQISQQQREASFYTVEQDELLIWPTPTESGIQYTLYGYRSFADFPDAVNEPDLERPFHQAIVWYMLYMYFQREEDLELARLYYAEYERTVNQQIAAAMRGAQHTAGPMIFGGDPLGPISFDRWVKRNVEGGRGTT